MQKVKLHDPVRNPDFGWYVAGGTVAGYLNKDGAIYATTKRDSDDNHVYANAWEDPYSGYWETYDLALVAKKDYQHTVIQPEPQLAVYDLEDPVQYNDRWFIRTKDTGCYLYALTEYLEIRHPAYRGYWDTYDAALFAKLRYERKIKHLPQQKG